MWARMIFSLIALITIVGIQFKISNKKLKRNDRITIAIIYLMASTIIVLVTTQVPSPIHGITALLKPIPDKIYNLLGG